MANSETNLPNVDNAQFHMPDVNKLVGTPLSPNNLFCATRAFRVDMRRNIYDISHMCYFIY